MIWSTGIAWAEITLGKSEQNWCQVIVHLDGTGFPHLLKSVEKSESADHINKYQYRAGEESSYIPNLYIELESSLYLFLSEWNCIMAKYLLILEIT